MSTRLAVSLASILLVACSGASNGGSGTDAPADADPSSDANTLYAVYFPAGTQVTLELGGQSSLGCQTFAGYHSEVNINGTKVGYAAMPVCTTFDDLTVTASHEYLEWATDPLPLTAPAFT